MLTVKKILAGRGAVDYYLNQTRRGLADYYLPDERADDGDEAARPGAGALYNRTLEAQLTRRLGVVWRDRPDGLRELDGVDDDLIAAFSSRRRAITAPSPTWPMRTVASTGSTRR